MLPTGITYPMFFINQLPEMDCPNKHFSQSRLEGLNFSIRQSRSQQAAEHPL